MSTITMVETSPTSEVNISSIGKKRPLDYYPNKTSPPKDSGFTSISTISSLHSLKNRCTCCKNVVGILTCRNVLNHVDVHIPKKCSSVDNVVLSYAGYSAEGSCPTAKKVNQDCIIMMEDVASNSLVLACLDGHGLYGDKLSQAFKIGLENHLFSHPLFISDPKEAICSVLTSIENEIRVNEHRIGDFSGSTLSLLMIRGNKLLVANVGDSRAIIGKRKPKHHHHYPHDVLSSSPVVSSREGSPRLSPRLDNGGTGSIIAIANGLVKWKVGAHKLTIDHKPDRPDEYRRILQKGGRVFSVRYEDGVIGPARVWLPSANIPGLAMSRSLGDLVVHGVGVISTPEFHEIDLDVESDCVLVVATDGLWDFVNNDEVMKIVSTKPDPGQGVKALLEESRKRWLAKEEMVDDTTICVVYLEGMSQIIHQNEKHNSSSSCNSNNSNDKQSTSSV